MANIVQYNSGTVLSQSSITLSFTNNTSQGDILVAVISTMGTSNHVVSINDTQGNRWYKASQSNTYNDIEVWYAIATLSQSETITINMANAGDINAIIIEISGINYNNIIAGQYVNSGQNTNPELSFSPALNNVFVLSAVNLVIPSTASPSTNEVPTASPISPATYLQHRLQHHHVQVYHFR